MQRDQLRFQLHWSGGRRTRRTELQEKNKPASLQGLELPFGRALGMGKLAQCGHLPCQGLGPVRPLAKAEDVLKAGEGRARSSG